jgi:hypothetical protein
MDTFALRLIPLPFPVPDEGSFPVGIASFSFIIS